MQILRCRNSCALFLPLTDQPAYFKIHLHLRQICRHKRIQLRKHGTVVNILSDIHRIPPPFPYPTFNFQNKGKRSEPKHFPLL